MHAVPMALEQVLVDSPTNVVDLPKEFIKDANISEADLEPFFKAMRVMDDASPETLSSYDKVSLPVLPASCCCTTGGEPACQS
jgi:hypothetical protein